MRSLTLLSILIASYLSNPVVHSGNNLARRASNRKEEDVAINANVNTDVNEDHNRHYGHGLLGDFYLGGLIRKILRLLGLYNDYDYDFDSNDDLLGLLVLNGDISEEEADRVGDTDILGLFRGSRSHGLLSKLINLDAAVASDQDVADEERKMTENSNDTVAVGVTALESKKDEDDVNTDVDTNVQV